MANDLQELLTRVGGNASAERLIRQIDASRDARVARVKSAQKLVDDYTTLKKKHEEAREKKVEAANKEQAKAAGKDEATPVKPVSTPFNVSGNGEGPPMDQAQRDLEVGEPSAGGGGLGAGVRAAMGSVPEQIESSETTWSPHKTWYGYTGMPTTSTRRTDNAATPFQAGSLALREQGLKAAKVVADRNYRAAKEQNFRTNASSYMALTGNAQDSLYMAATHPFDWDKARKDKLTKVFTDKGMAAAEALQYERAVEDEKMTLDWYKVVRPIVVKGIKDGSIRNTNQVGVDSLLGMGPASQSVKDDMVKELAKNTSYIGEQVANAQGNFNVITPETLWARIGAPASRQSQLVVATSKDMTWGDRVFQAFNPVNAMASKSGFGTVPASKVYGLLDTMRDKDASNEERQKAIDDLTALKIISGADRNTGIPQPVTEGAFSQTSRAALLTYSNLRGLQTEFPQLQDPNIQRSVLEEKASAQMQGASGDPRMIQAVDEVTMGIVDRIRNQSRGR